MADSRELKPTSFRIDNATAEKFREITSNIGGNQQEALSKLIEIYEFQLGKSNLVDRKEDIEEFESHITIITRKYMDILESCQNAKELANAKFEASIKSQDDLIKNLQEQLQEAKLEKEQAEQSEKQLQSMNESLSKEKEKLLKDNVSLENDKQALNSQLEDKGKLIENLEKEKADFQEAHKEYKGLQEEISKLKAQIQELGNIKSKQELEHEKAMLELKEKYTDEINQLKDEYFKKIESYQNKWLEQQISKKTTTTRKTTKKENTEK